jgi:hypothetical protein
LRGQRLECVPLFIFKRMPVVGAADAGERVAQAAIGDVGADADTA